MLAPGVHIVGVASLLLDEDRLILRVLCSDGSIAATWWPLEDLNRFVYIVEEATRPIGAVLQ